MLSIYVAQIAVAANGNPSITVRRRGTTGLDGLHPAFPPIALPASTFPDALSAEGYAEALIRTAGLLDNNGQHGLVWVSTGYTIVNGQRMAARTAAIADPR
jgi:hypothetical protein